MRQAESYLEKQLRAAIRRSGLSVYRLAKESGVSQPALCRFVNKERSLTLANASKLIDFLELELKSKK